MSNPIFSGIKNANNQNQQTSNMQPTGFLGMLQQIKKSPNPNTAMQQMLSSNPNFQGIVNYINQNGGDAKTAFYNLAAQKGVDPNSILNQLR